MMLKKKINVVSLVLLLGLFVVSLAYGSELKRTILKVEQMRCSSCLRVFDAELRKVQGIAGMTANFSEGLVFVDHEDVVLPQQLSNIIVKLGYPATIVSSKGITDKEVNRFKVPGFGGGSGFCNPGGSSPVTESWKELKRRFFRKGRGRGQGK